jgi:antirestriction protein ArdC
LILIALLSLMGSFIGSVVLSIADTGIPATTAMSQQGNRVSERAGRCSRRSWVSEAQASQKALDQTRVELAHIARVSTLGELTASIAHEVNQPLAGVVSGDIPMSGYSAEELVAELGSAFMCAEFGFDNMENEAGYIAHWIKFLSDHETAIVAASSAPGTVALDRHLDCIEQLLFVQWLGGNSMTPDFIARIDEFMAATGTDIRYGESCAYYSRKGDYVNLPADADHIGRAALVAVSLGDQAVKPRLLRHSRAQTHSTAQPFTS